MNRTCLEWIAQVRYKTGPQQVLTSSSSTFNVLAFQDQQDAEACFLVDKDTSSPTYRATHDISIFGPSSWLDNGDGALASRRKIQKWKITPVPTLE
jgi:hypothetical protein